MITTKRNAGLEVNLNEYKKLRLPQSQGDYFEVSNKVIIRETLNRFLPNVEEGTNTVRFSHVIGSHDKAAASKPIGKTKIPITELDALESGVEMLVKKKDSETSAPKAKAIAENFRLPDPDAEPEMYRMYGWPWDRKLIVLWGCERTLGSSIEPLAATQKLRRNPKPLWRIWWERVFLILLALLLLLALAGGIDLLLGRVGMTAEPFFPWPKSVVNAIWKKEPPVIAKQPQDRRAPLGVDATFTVTVTGTVPLAYQWQFNGTNLPGAIQSSYTRNDVKARDAGTYSVAISNIAGSVTSSNAVLTVVPGIAKTDLTNQSPGMNQYFRVMPVVALLPTNLAVWARAAGTVDFHGQKQLQISANQTNYYDGFSKRGKYRIEWTPEDSTLNIEARIVDLDTVPITNRAHLPFANLQLVPKESQPGEAIRADERASFHGDPSGKLVKFEINWDQKEFQVLNDSTRIHRFDTKGTYPVALRVTDNKGQTSTDTETAYVGIPVPSTNENPPIARLRLVSKDVKTLTAVVADDGSVAQSGKISSWTINWGDHTPDQRFTDVPTNESHTFTTHEKFEISLTCVDDHRRPSHDAAIVEVDFSSGYQQESASKSNSLPYANTNVAGTNAYISLSVAANRTAKKVLFDARVDAFAFPVDLKVDFGDSSPIADFTLGSAEHGEKQNEQKQFDHEYPSNTSYTVMATATDAKGGSDTQKVIISPLERLFELVKTANEPVDSTHVKVSLLVRDKQDNNATDFPIHYWLVNDNKNDRIERDYTISLEINTTNTVYAGVEAVAGSPVEVGIQIIVPQKIVSVTQPGEVQVQSLIPRKP